MKRLAALMISWGLITLALAPVATAYAPVVSPSPQSGPPGTAVTVIASGFLPGVPLEAHATDKSGTLLGTAVANGQGIAGIQITIPANATPGTFTIYVCGSCASEFYEEAITTFQVTKPTTSTTSSTSTTSTTTTTTTTTTTIPVTAPPATEPSPCAIPAGATVIDFDAWDRSLGDSEDMFGALQRAVWDAGYHLALRQWSRYVLYTDPSTDETPSVLMTPRINSVGFVADNPARDLTTSSPPNVMRLIDDTHWSYAPTIVFPSVMPPDYFGFNVGFGHFGEGFETPDELVVSLAVRAMPMEMPDGTILDQGAWDTVAITLGPGPQPVLFCLEAHDTAPGTPHHETVYLIDILPRTTGGEPVHIPVDIDDFFYGWEEGSPTPPLVLDVDPADLPGAAGEVPPITTVTTIVDIGDPPPDPSDLPDPAPSDLPWRVAFGLGGLLLGAVGVFWLKR